MEEDTPGCLTKVVKKETQPHPPLREARHCIRDEDGNNRNKSIPYH